VQEDKAYIALRRWCDDHSIKVLDTNKLAYRHTRQNIKYFQHALDYNLLENNRIQVETEPLYTIEITEDELVRMAEFENQVFNNMREKGHFNMFEVLMEQKKREKMLRTKYAAVQKAYEQYSMVLKLAESGEL
jgi:hypothetical protein